MERGFEPPNVHGPELPDYLHTYLYAYVDLTGDRNPATGAIPWVALAQYAACYDHDPWYLMTVVRKIDELLGSGS